MLEAPSAPRARAGKPQQQAIEGFPFPLSPLPIRLPQAPGQGKNSFPLVPLIQNSGSKWSFPVNAVDPSPEKREQILSEKLPNRNKTFETSTESQCCFHACCPCRPWVSFCPATLGSVLLEGAPIAPCSSGRVPSAAQPCRGGFGSVQPSASHVATASAQPAAWGAEASW